MLLLKVKDEVLQLAAEFPDPSFQKVDLKAFKRGKSVVWSQLNFDLHFGKWTALLGKSGIGKTTLLRCLAGLEVNHPFLFPGHKVALLAQNNNLLPWATVLGNVVIGSQLRGEKPDLDLANALLEQVSLKGYAKHYPMQLSVGMRQRVAIARTLYEKADIILLDEPFTALDTKIKYDLYRLTTKVLADKTVILVTHDPLEALKLCQFIYLFKGTPPKLEPFLFNPIAPTSVTADTPDFKRLLEAVLCA